MILKEFEMPRRKLAIDAKTAAKDISGKVYIVTGANSGVGLETTRQLVKQILLHSPHLLRLGFRLLF